MKYSLRYIFQPFFSDDQPPKYYDVYRFVGSDSDYNHDIKKIKPKYLKYVGVLSIMLDGSILPHHNFGDYKKKNKVDKLYQAIPQLEKWIEENNKEGDNNNA